MRRLGIWLAVALVSTALARIPENPAPLAFWPAIVAVAVIGIRRQAAEGLAAGVVAGALLLAEGRWEDALRDLFTVHLWPQFDSAWHLGALIFTLLLGAFAGLLEWSGGFRTLLGRMLRGSRDPRRRVLGSVYGLGLLCFFDGLANSLLTGRIARAAVDRVGVSREKLAWVVDSTSSPVACVAFISTWIATQLTLIRDSLPGAEPYALYFRSIPANPYCLLTLMLVPLAVALRWEPEAMRRFTPPPARPDDPGTETDADPADENPAAPWRVLLPLGVLAAAIAAGFQIWSGRPIDWTSLDVWRAAAGGDAGPTAMVFGAIAGLLAAWICLPADRRRGAGHAALQGAAGLLPALLVLIFAWTLGGIFRDLGAAGHLKTLLGESLAPAWLPLGVFAVTALTAFVTGSSWGTMALLMPLALGVLTETSATPEFFAPPVIGAVFGGAVFGDHASPFSDTTIVSALAAGCQPLDHVLSQLPYALVAAAAAGLGYLLIALGLPAPAATTIAGAALAATVWRLSRGGESTA
jgi:Na+/H+ antiporter NhaC